MRKSSKRVLFAAMAGIMLIMAGCGNTNTGTGGTPSPTATPSQSASPSATATPDAAKELSGKILLEGSTSMQKIMQEMADTFMAKNLKVTIDPIFDGSGPGIKAAAEGNADIGMASRNVKDEEKVEGLTSLQVAWDAIAIVINPDNGVTELTADQIAKIYTKEITNWKDVGGPDAQIVVVARDAASGTREAFEGLFKVAEKVVADQEAASTGEVKTFVSQNPNAIGYISLTFVDSNVKALTVDGMVPSEENVANGSYTLKRPFNIVYKGTPNEITSAFIDFIYSEEGKAIIAKEALPVDRQ